MSRLLDLIASRVVSRNKVRVRFISGEFLKFCAYISEMPSVSGVPNKVSSDDALIIAHDGYKLHSLNSNLPSRLSQHRK